MSVSSCDFHMHMLKMRTMSWADLAKALAAPCLDEAEMLRIKEENVANGAESPTKGKAK